MLNHLNCSLLPNSTRCTKLYPKAIQSPKNIGKLSYRLIRWERTVHSRKIAFFYFIEKTVNSLQLRNSFLCIKILCPLETTRKSHIFTWEIESLIKKIKYNSILFSRFKEHGETIFSILNYLNCYSLAISRAMPSFTKKQASFLHKKKLWPSYSTLFMTKLFIVI